MSGRVPGSWGREAYTDTQSAALMALSASTLSRSASACSASRRSARCWRWRRMVALSSTFASSGCMGAVWTVMPPLCQRQVNPSFPVR